MSPFCGLIMLRYGPSCCISSLLEFKYTIISLLPSSVDMELCCAGSDALWAMCCWNYMLELHVVLSQWCFNSPFGGWEQCVIVCMLSRAGQCWQCVIVCVVSEPWVVLAVCMLSLSHGKCRQCVCCLWAMDSNGVHIHPLGKGWLLALSLWLLVIDDALLVVD